MDDVAAWFLALYKTTGIKLTIFYDGYDRNRFLEGFVTTVKLSAYCLVGSLLLGALGWAVVSLTLLETAFAAEIYRAGIEAVPKEMSEAAASLGFSRMQVYRQ